MSTVVVSHEGTFKEATGMWVSFGGVWNEVQTGGGGAPPASAAVAKLTANVVDTTLTATWANAVVTVPAPIHYEVLLGATTDPQVLPAEWVVVGTVPFVAGPLVQNTWTGADPGRAPGSYTYAMVVSVGADESRSSPSYTNPVLPDPMPTGVVSLGGVWTSITENILFWDIPVEPDATTEFVVHYSATGEIANAGEGTLLGTVPRGVEATYSYAHTKDAAEQEIPLYYSVFPRRADGLIGPHATQTITKGEVPPPSPFSASGDSPSSVSIVWGPPAYPVDATGYRLVYRGDMIPTGPDDPAATVLLDNAPLTTLTYNHTGLAQQTTYYYLIACNQPDGYGLSNADSGTTTKPPPPVPDYVQGYSVSPGIMWCWFFVSWSIPANTTEILSYEIRCAPNAAPQGGGTFVRTVYPGSVTSYLRTVYESYVTSQTMGVSTNARNASGQGPWADGVATLGGFANSMCLARTQEVGVYDPTPGTIEELGLAWVEDFERITGFQAPHDVDEAWDIVAEMIESDEVDDDNWWTRICFALEVPLWMDKPSEAAWDRADAIRLSPRTPEILNYWEEVLPEVVNEHDKDTAVLALMECMSALGTAW